MTMPPSPRLSAAFDHARAAHGGQRRKGTALGYISHPMSVSALVMEHGGDEDPAIAGLLHHVIEDCGAEHEPLIRERFGGRVADIVLACTDGVPDASGSKAPWRARKERYLAHLETVSNDALLVAACDKLHNARAIASDLAAGHDVFARFAEAGRDGALWYFGELVRILGLRLGETNPLFRQLEAAVAAMSDPRAGR
jgi:GTP pyrophosphokinase